MSPCMIQVDDWLRCHRDDRAALKDALSNGRCRVDRAIFHTQWLTGNVDRYESPYQEEVDEEERREYLVRKALKALEK